MLVLTNSIFRAVFLALIFAVGCGQDSDHTEQPASDPIPIGPTGFVGSPCGTVADCTFTNPTCLGEVEGFPDGMCGVGCSLYCPDRYGFPTTFCVEDAALPPGAPVLGDGTCAARCDFGFFPTTGCREDYGCVVENRANEPGTQNYVCLPNVESELSECYFELVAMGLSFEPTWVAGDSPSGQPGLTCNIEDALRVKSPLYDVDLLNYFGNSASTIVGSCEFAKALAQTVADVEDLGAVSLQYGESYNCRVISGTSTLSRHAYGDAIDIYGFGFADGETYTLIDDWEHDTNNPQGEAAAFLYDTAYRWYDEEYWNVILTPNYNAAHDTHFHVDLTPDIVFIGSITDDIGCSEWHPPRGNQKSWIQLETERRGPHPVQPPEI